MFHFFNRFSKSYQKRTEQMRQTVSFLTNLKKNNNNKIVWWCVCVCFSKVNWYLFFLFLSNFNPYLGGFESNLFPLFVMEFYFCCAGIFYIYDFHTYTVCNFGLYFSNRNFGIVILFCGVGELVWIHSIFSFAKHHICCFLFNYC